MQNANINTNNTPAVKLEKKKKFSGNEKRFYNKLMAKFEVARKDTLSGLLKYRQVLTDIQINEAEIEKEEKVFTAFCKASDDGGGSDNDKPPSSTSPLDYDNNFSSYRINFLPPFIALLCIIALYLIDLFMIKDAYFYIANSLGFYPVIKDIIAFVLPAIMILFYFLIFYGLQKRIHAYHNDDDSEFIGKSKQVYDYSLFHLSYRKGFLLNVLKFVPVVTILFSLGFTVFNPRIPSGAKTSQIIVSIILIGFHLVTIELFPKILLSLRYFSYSKKLNRLEDKNTILKAKLPIIKNLLIENLLELKRLSKMLKEFNVNIDLEIIFSEEDYKLLVSFKNYHYSFGSDDV